MESAFTQASYNTHRLPTWCPGCGDFGIWMSLKNALAKLGISPENLLMIYDIGCNSNMYDWMHTYGFVGLHGRTLPVGQAARLANHDVPIICISGDGGGLGEGGGHFVACSKRNPNITNIIHDNQVYGLTTGQASPSAKKGLKTKSTPHGAIDEPLNPLSLAISCGATFVARGFAGDMAGLTDLIVQAVNHKGFSVLDVLQPCVTFNKFYSYNWYRERVYYLPKEFDNSNKLHAYEKSLEWGDKIPMGVFYKLETKTQEEFEPALEKGPLVKQKSADFDLNSLLKEFI